MMNAADIASGLQARKSGRGWSAKCPAHDDGSPSLSINATRDGRPLVFCHAGCPQEAVIDALRARGLWPGENFRDPGYPGRITTRQDRHRDADDRSRERAAIDIWERADPAKGTLVEAYLQSRGVSLPSSHQLGFHPRVPHKDSGTEWPCMIGAIRDRNDRVTAIQRTYLAKDGRGKAPVKPSKMTLGPMLDGAVKLFPAGEVLGLAEGIETALSATKIYMVPVWATLSANRLNKVFIPKIVKQVTIFGDSGDVGRRSACEAAEAYERIGLKADVIFPAAHFSTKHSDFNDCLTGSTNEREHVECGAPTAG